MSEVKRLLRALNENPDAVLRHVDEDQQDAFLRDLIERARAEESRTERLAHYLPYGHPDTLCPDGLKFVEMLAAGKWTRWSNKPWQLDFHNSTEPERMLMSANQVGKTTAAGAEVAMHLTGEYPDWFEGHRYLDPIRAWAGSVTSEGSRDTAQAEIVGGLSEGQFGTGFLSLRHIVDIHRRRSGVDDVLEMVVVKHISGGYSFLHFKAYEQGWRKWQGTPIDLAWLDEQPDESTLNEKRIFSEAQTRLVSKAGRLIVTFTPLLGLQDMVEHFLAGSPGTAIFNATWDDAPHLTEEVKMRLRATYPEHEIETRTMGVPMMGEGRVFMTNEAEIKIKGIDIPSWWPRIIGIDFGIDHPAALAEIAWDRENDIIYLIRTWAKSNAETEEHVAAILESGQWIPVAWPHDGTRRAEGKASGVRIKDQYANMGVRMLAQSARYKREKGGGQPTEPVILDLQRRANDGRFKALEACTEFFDEYRLYHRKDGQLTKRRDDVLKSLFYAMMMLRFAQTNINAQRKPKLPTRSIASMRA